MFVNYGHDYSVSSSKVMTYISSTIGHKLIVTISLLTDRFLNGVICIIVIIVIYTSVVVRISINNNITVHTSYLLLISCWYCSVLLNGNMAQIVLLLLLVMIWCLPDAVAHSFWPVILLTQPAEATKLSNKIKPLSGHVGEERSTVAKICGRGN